MAQDFARPVARILSKAGEVWGAGFAVEGGLVITCAHVVNQALGRQPEETAPPDKAVRLDLPQQNRPACDATVTAWFPPQPPDRQSPDDVADVAVLAPTTPPADVIATERFQPHFEWGEQFRAFGFPPGFDYGVFAEGELQAATSSGWAQLLARNEQKGYFVEPGFSGGPIFAAASDAILGMVAAADRDRQRKQAFAILTRILFRACPRLARPYRGLFAFQEEHAEFFFGREVFTSEIEAKLREKRFVAVIGPSGSGKSSVVAAGLLPQLRAQRQWAIATLRPGDRPLFSLAYGLAPLLKQGWIDGAERLTLAQAWQESFSKDPGQLTNMARAVFDTRRDLRRLLIYCDQFEELFTLCADQEACRAFLANLLAAASNNRGPEVSCLVTMRADFVGQALQYRELADALRDADVKLGPMTEDELRQAISAPAAKLGVRFEPGAGGGASVADRIVSEVLNDPASLPLMEFVLDQLWQHQCDRAITHAACKDLGGVKGALSKHAEAVYSAFDDATQAKVRQVFTRLVNLGEGTEDTRKIATRRDLGEELWPIVQELADARLLATGRDEQRDEQTAEVVHEVLIRTWARLRAWLDQDREFLLWRQRLKPMIERWLKAGKDDAALLKGRFLAEAQGWVHRRGTWLSANERAFVKASTIAEERVQRRDLRVTRALKGIAVGLLIALAFAGWMWWRATGAESIAVQERDKATAAAESAGEAAKVARANESRALSALSEIASSKHRYLDALKLALAAWPRTPDGDRPELRATIEALGQAVPQQRQTVPLLRHEAPVQGAAFSSDASRILTWSQDGTARVWDAATGKEVLAPLRHDAAVAGAAFNNDESRILTWSRDGTARVWDAATGKEVLAPLRHEAPMWGATFNRDESLILTWSDDNTARVWDAVTGKEVLALRHEDYVFGAAFNQDASRILTWSLDGTARVWDAATGKEVLAPLRHEAAVWGAAFNGDESRIVTWSLDGSARVWDAATGKEVLAPLRHDAQVAGAAFNGDESRILTWSRDGTARVWDAATGKEMLALRHDAPVQGAAFNRDESQILTWSDDNTARVWDAPTGKAVLAPLHHEAPVAGAAFNGDASLIVTWSDDNTARVWDAATGKEVPAPLRHEAAVRGAAFNSDESLILTWSDDNTARVWDAPTGKAMPAPLRHEDAVGGATFNGDKSRVVTWSRNGIARVWDVATRKEVLALRHDAPVWGAAFNQDASRIVTWSLDGSARVWDAATGKEVLAPLRHEAPVAGAAFNRDESRILTWSLDGTARVWDAATSKEVLAPLRHEAAVWGAVFNGDESRILTWSLDGTARVWDAATGKEVLAPLRHDAAVQDAAFNGDESQILTWSEDNIARVWDISRLPHGHLIEVACKMLPDHDTSELKKLYGIAITEPICGPNTPAPVWAELED